MERDAGGQVRRAGVFGERMDVHDNLSAVLLSDTHLKDDGVRLPMFRAALARMRRLDYDLFISAGDTTDHGNKSAWFAAQRALEQTPPARRSLIALGNHDTWNQDARRPGQSRYEASLPLYLDFLRKTCGIVSERPWFSVTVKGVPFLFLGTEGDRVGGVIGEEQLAFAAAALDRASRENTFIFVVSHWPFKGSHGLPLTFGEGPDCNIDKCTWGENDAPLLSLLQKYDRVIYLCGHSHMGWVPPRALRARGYASVEVLGNVLSVNLPCFLLNHDGENNLPGLGVDLTVYDATAVLRVRNFLLPGAPVLDKLTIEKK